MYDAQDRKVYEHMVGDFTPDRRVAVASSSKMVAGTVLFEVIRQGHLSLDSTTGEVLGWTGDKANITTQPRKGQGTTNPLIAGGLRTSMNEYAALLGVVFHQGSHAGLRLGTAELFDAQMREPFPGVVIGNSPVKDLGRNFRYGLTAWLHCDTPAEGCDVISSPGAFGWTPWVDHEAGYYAVLGMQLDRNDEGVVGFSVDLMVELQPLIRAALTP